MFLVGFFGGVGLVYATMIGLYVHSIGITRKGAALPFRIPGPLLSWFFWPLLSGVGYYVAVTIASGTKSDSFLPGGFMEAGIFGAAIMLVGFHFTFQRLDKKSYLLLVGLGGILALSYLFGGEYLFLPLFVVWQTGMTLGLGYVLVKNSELTSEISHIS